MEEYNPIGEIINKFLNTLKSIFLNLIFFKDPNPYWYQQYYKECNTVFDNYYKDFVFSKNIAYLYNRLTDQQKYYYNLKRLRRFLESSPCEEWDVLAYKHFTARKVNDHLEKVMEYFVSLHRIKNSTKPRSFIGKLNCCYEAYKKAPRYLKISFFKLLQNSLNGHFNISFDPHLRINPPNFLYFLHIKKRKVRNIRMGTPTQQSFNKVKIIPEFKAFLRSVKWQKKIHLYVNLQRRYKTFFSDESSRVSAIEKLSADFPDNLLVITLDKDSDFYYQRGAFENHYEIYKFKRAIVEQIVDNKNKYYYFFKEVFELDFKYFISSLFDEIHVKYFYLKTILDPDERNNFIDLVHINIVEWILNIFEVDSFNISCKDSIDRAGAMNALLYLYLHRNGSKNFSSCWPIIALMPAITVKRRNMLPARYEGLVSVARRIIQIKN